ncbi:hypothetical protein [Tumebacillus avium]|uniref:hypothetical protein n=1 Tax=Tumebacillus avium TaxID=1903704 RepID=UPI0012FE1D7A|nr:hypothetical protein [Tumebacillus avium]
MKKPVLKALILTTGLLGVMGGTASASSNESDQTTLIVVDKVKEKKLDQRLQALGFPFAELASMPYDMKEHLINQGVVKYIGTEKREFYYDFDGTLREKDPSGTGIEGTIDLTDLSLVITTSQLATMNSKKRFTVTQKWEWSNTVGLNGDTYLNYVDKIGLSYSNDFDSDPYTNGGYACSHSGQHFFSGNHYWLSDCGGRPSDISYGGVGWNVDIRGDYRDYGWSAMNVVAKNTSDWNTSTRFLTKYAHDTSTSGVGVGLNIGFFSLNFTGNGSWDEGSAQKTIWY